MAIALLAAVLIGLAVYILANALSMAAPFGMAIVALYATLIGYTLFNVLCCAFWLTVWIIDKLRRRSD